MSPKTTANLLHHRRIGYINPFKACQRPLKEISPLSLSMFLASRCIPAHSTVALLPRTGFYDLPSLFLLIVTQVKTVRIATERVGGGTVQDKIGMEEIKVDCLGPE